MMHVSTNIKFTNVLSITGCGPIGQTGWKKKQGSWKGIVRKGIY